VILLNFSPRMIFLIIIYIHLFVKNV